MSLSCRPTSGSARDPVARSLGLQFRAHHSHARDAHLPAAAEDRERRRQPCHPGHQSGRLHVGAITPPPRPAAAFPRTVRVIEHTLIPLKDGTTLAARIWLPDDAEQNPVPAILEYLPYRKRDGTYERDALTHPYLAGHGYAGVRVDLRGCGEWSGFLVDEDGE